MMLLANSEQLEDVFAYRNEQLKVRIGFSILIFVWCALTGRSLLGGSWFILYSVSQLFEYISVKKFGLSRSNFAAVVLFVNSSIFGSIVFTDFGVTTVPQVFLLCTLLNIAATSRRSMAVYIASSVPIFIILMIWPLAISRFDRRQLLPTELAQALMASFAFLIWRSTSGSLSKAMEARALAEEAAQRAEGAQLRAEAATSAKSDFLANMSHELRTPLNGIVAMASALQRTKVTPAQAEMVKIVQTSAEMLRIVLSDVLDMAKIEAGRIDLQRDDVVPAALCRHVAALFSAPCAEKGLTFALETDTASEEVVLGDSVRLTQILTNLCSNAVKFTPEGHVRLSVRAQAAADRRAIRFEVADSGIGMTTDQQSRLFERFAQADGSITRRFGGTGLGLSICKQLIDLMGGAIEVESQEGRGSIFKLLIELPDGTSAAPASATEIGPPSTAALFTASDEGGGGFYRPAVLLVEDHAVNRRVVQIMLGELVDLDMAIDGVEAVEAVRIRSYDVILMDMQMPVMDGITATRAIRALETAEGRPGAPIIMLTANALPEHVAQSRQAGADAHLPKPISAESLLDALDKALAGRAADTQAA